MRLVRLAQGITIGVILVPLAGLGPCAVIAQTSVVNGFFEAVTPMLVERLRDDLGLSAAKAAGTSNLGVPPGQRGYWTPGGGA